MNVFHVEVDVADSIIKSNFITFMVNGNKVTYYSSERIMPKENDYTLQFFELLYENLKD